ncbi:hypothetical protein QL285_092993 [Trifolium repens]|nr:hypothetical protein QL285_092993 [Trifolium repens]
MFSDRYRYSLRTRKSSSLGLWHRCQGGWRSGAGGWRSGAGGWRSGAEPSVSCAVAQGSGAMAHAREINPINTYLIQKKGYRILTAMNYFSQAIPEVLKQDFKCGNTF